MAYSQTLVKTLMQEEAAAAADAVTRQTIAAEAGLRAATARLRDDPPTFALTCARGSSDHAASYAKFLFETRLGLPTVSYQPSLSSLYRASLQGTANAVFIAISQSGRSPDLLAATQAARRDGAFVIGLVNDATSPLAEVVDVLLPLAAGEEKSVAATKSYIATLALFARLVARWSEDPALDNAVTRLPGLLRTAWDADWSAGVAPLATAESVFVLGRGSTLGIAQEAALKLKETCAIHAEAFSLAEVAHGPMTLVGPGFPVLVFAPLDVDPGPARPVLDTLREAGADLMMIGDDRFPIGGDFDPTLAPIAMIQSFYRLANAVALARGRDPDRPPLLRKVTQTR